LDERTSEWLARELADASFEPTCWVDSAAGVRLLAEGLGGARAPRPLPLLVELAHAGGRTGCRSLEDGLAVAAAVGAAPALRLAGVAGYEGTICGDRTSACR